MAIKIFGWRIDFSRVDDVIEGAIDELGGFVDVQADRVVARLKATPLGDAVANSIEAVDNEALSGAEKFEAVVSEAAPLVLNFVRDGGIDAAIDDVTDITRQLTQSVYNDFKSTGFGKLVNALLDFLGL